LQQKQHQDANQISGESVQVKNVNSNTTEDVFLAFTTVQQIMTCLTGTETIKEKVVVITKVVFRQFIGRRKS
jgi:hypothetical protein